MSRYVLWRLVQFPLVLAVIYLITFLLVWVAPGDPFQKDEKPIDEMALQQMRRELHAETAWSFLAHYPAMLMRGNFGPSFSNPERSVGELISGGLKVSVTLGLFGLFLAVVGGVTLGTLAAVRRGGVLDWLSLALAVVGISLPGFVSAAVLLMLFAVKWPIFSIGGWSHVGDIVLPAVAVALGPMAYIARLTRVSMLDVLGQDYVRTARAKGLSRFQVVWRHCLRNAFLPVLSYLGPAAAATMTGSFIVEQVFNLPGLGQHFVNSVRNRDQTLILGTVVVYSVLLLSLNLLVDLAYAWVDPRIEVGGGRRR
jgi:ABC-type dipeptide/oligopeptide/nickel transport system permease component